MLSLLCVLPNHITTCIQETLKADTIAVRCTNSALMLRMHNDLVIMFPALDE